MKSLLMTSLLEMVKNVDLRKVDKSLLPAGKVESGEKVVGVLPDHLRRFYIAVLTMNRDVKATCEKVHARFQSQQDAGVKPSQLTAEEKKLLYEHAVQHEWIDQVSQLFWLEVTNEFPELVMPGFGKGLRQGWQVVSWNPIHEATRSLITTLEDFLKS